MAGWLAQMLIVAVAGRETTRELNVFQIMEVRSIIGFLMLYPLIRMHGGFAAMKTSRPLQHIGRNLIHYVAQIGWFDYFIVCTALGLPGMLLLLRIAPWRTRS